jgi:hypothetical protein
MIKSYWWWLLDFLLFEWFFFQDAKKGMLFIDFPPVLQLQLKRFEYDFVRDTMLKVCTWPFIFYLSLLRFPLFTFCTFIVVASITLEKFTLMFNLGYRFVVLNTLVWSN